MAACSSPSQPPPVVTTAVAPPVFFEAGHTGAQAAARVRVTHAPAAPPDALRADPAARGKRIPTAEAAARWHLAQQADRLGLDTATLASAEVALVHDLGHGPIVIKLRQRVDGIPVARRSLAIVMNRSSELVATTGELAPVATGPRAFTLSAADAITRAIADAGAAPRALATAADHAGYQQFTADDLLVPARARRVLFPVDGQLVAADEPRRWSTRRPRPMPSRRPMRRRRPTLAARASMAAAGAARPAVRAPPAAASWRSRS